MDAIYSTLKLDEITDQYDPAEMENQKILSILVYVFAFLFFLPIVSNKESAYSKTVANQALTMLIGCIALGIVSGLLSLILGFIPFLGGLVGKIINLAYWAFVVLKVIDVANGKVRTLPFGFEITAFK